MNAVVKKIEMILKSSYDTKNYVDLIREIFPKVSMVSPDKFRKEFTNFRLILKVPFMWGIIKHQIKRISSLWRYS